MHVCVYINLFFFFFDWLYQSIHLSIYLYLYIYIYIRVEVTKLASNLVEVFLPKFDSCPYASFDTDLKDIVIEYLQDVGCNSQIKKYSI